MNAGWGITVLLVAVILPSSVMSADRGSTIDDYYIDFGVPDLTALTLMGANSNKVLRPNTMKELATGFLSVAETGGDIRPGVAVEWTPVRPETSLSRYRDSRFKYIQIAFGTAKDGDLTDFGLGLRWNIIDRTDPLGNREYHQRLIDAFDSAPCREPPADNRLRMEFTRAAGSHITALADSLVARGLYSRAEADRIADHLGEDIWELNSPPEPLLVELVHHRAIAYYVDKGLFDAGADVEKRVKELAEFYVLTLNYVDRIRGPGTKACEKALGDARRNFQKNSWNAPVLTVAGGWIARSPDSSWRRLKGDRFSGIAGGAFPLGRSIQGIVQVEGRVAARDSVVERSSWGAGGRLVAGFGDRRVSLEGYYTSTDNRDPRPDINRWRLTIGLELKLTKDVWFEVAVGGEFDDDSDDSTILALGNIKYGIRKQPRFDL